MRVLIACLLVGCGGVAAPNPQLITPNGMQVWQETESRSAHWVEEKEQRALCAAETALAATINVEGWRLFVFSSLEDVQLECVSQKAMACAYTQEKHIILFDGGWDALAHELVHAGHLPYVDYKHESAVWGEVLVNARHQCEDW